MIRPWRNLPSALKSGPRHEAPAASRSHWAKPSWVRHATHTSVRIVRQNWGMALKHGELKIPKGAKLKRCSITRASLCHISSSLLTLSWQGPKQWLLFVISCLHCDCQNITSTVEPYWITGDWSWAIQPFFGWDEAQEGFWIVRF